jgi:nondiscriminating aspartyl-tRNA synthetase
MNRTLIKDLRREIGNEAYLSGFIRNIREFKDFRFVFVRDRSGMSQIVVPNAVCPERIGYEDVIGIEGTILTQPKSRYDGIEVLAKRISFLARGKEGASFNPKEEPNLNIETALDRRTASLRLDEGQAVFLAQSHIIGGLTGYLRDNDFIEVKTPKITISALDGGSDLFKVEYFKNAAYLTQSPQLYHQMLMGSFERIFEVGPCFRAEDYATSRHISEFTSLDVQMSFIKDHRELMDLLENALSTLKVPNLMIRTTMPRISYEEAVTAIKKRPMERKLSGEDKRDLGVFAKEKYSSDFLFIEGFPIGINAFYIMPDRDHFTKSFKLLYKGQEICTGGMRINDYDQLSNSMSQKGLNLEEFEDYLESFRCGIPPHGGFCIGINRLTSLIFDLDNVKRAVLFPRDPRRLTP